MCAKTCSGTHLLSFFFINLIYHWRTNSNKFPGVTINVLARSELNHLILGQSTTLVAGKMDLAGEEKLKTENCFIREILGSRLQVCCAEIVISSSARAGLACKTVLSCLARRMQQGRKLPLF